jgi:hypothetical protein
VRRIIERVLLAAIVFAMTGFVLLVLIGLWDRYEKQAAASGFNEADGRYLAPQAVSPRGSDTHSDAMTELSPHVAVARDRLGSAQVVRQEPKQASTHAFDGTNQGMSVALSADGSTAIMGGPGPHNADVGRSPFVGPAGAAWEAQTRDGQLLSRPTAILLSWVDLATICGIHRCPSGLGPPGRHGYSLEMAVAGRRRARSS